MMILVTVLPPFGNVTRGVVQPEIVLGVRAHRRRSTGKNPRILTLTPAPAVGTAVGVIGFFAPPKDIGRTAARGVLPFRFRGQTVAGARLFAQPLHIGLRVIPADVNHRLIIPSPRLVIGKAAVSGPGEAIIIGKGNFVSTDPERLADSNLLLGHGVTVESAP